ncbi:MAG: hypothetical protein ACLFST_13625 [Spirochaetia bacterium]
MPENLNWKIVAGAAAGAFLIAFIIAGVAGVGFGKMILRGFLGALVFGALGAGLSIVIARFLPELLTPQEQTSAEEDFKPKETGRNVDVVVENDEEIGAGVYNLEVADDEELEEIAGDSTGDSEEPAADLEPAEDLPESGEAGSGENVNFNEDTDDSLVEEVEELSPEEDDSEEFRESIAAETVEPDDDVENLPDVDRFSGSFQDTLEQDEENEQEEPPRKQFSPEQENPFPDQDPETMARAIRTALKRDSE